MSTAKPKIVVLDGQALNPGDLSWNDLSSQCADFRVFTRTHPSQIIKTCEGFDIIMTNKVNLHHETLEQLTDLKAICLMSTGYNVVDIAACDRLGIHVINVPAYSTPFVAQHTFALILELFNKVGETSQKVRSGQWQSRDVWCYYDHTLRELESKTLGIIGMGTIGQRVGKIGEAFGMKVIYHSRSKKSDLKYEYVELDDVFAQADIVSLHVQLTPDTKHLVNAFRLSLMKPSAFLINTGRGDLIVEEDLVQVLKAKKIAGAGLDVLTEEPPLPENRLIPLNNCIITPHQAWVSVEARQRLMDTLVSNVRSFVNETPKNVVNNPRFPRLLN